MQKTVQKIVEAIVGSKPSLLANRPKKTVEKSVEPTVRGTVGGNRLENRREETVERAVRQTVLVVNLETGAVKVKL
jgi:hypothetical protein